MSIQHFFHRRQDFEVVINYPIEICVERLKEYYSTNQWPDKFSIELDPVEDIVNFHYFTRPINRGEESIHIVGELEIQEYDTTSCSGSIIITDLFSIAVLILGSIVFLFYAMIEKHPPILTFVSIIFAFLIWIFLKVRSHLILKNFLETLIQPKKKRA